MYFLKPNLFLITKLLNIGNREISLQVVCLYYFLYI